MGRKPLKSSTKVTRPKESEDWTRGMEQVFKKWYMIRAILYCRCSDQDNSSIKYSSRRAFIGGPDIGKV